MCTHISSPIVSQFVQFYAAIYDINISKGATVFTQSYTSILRELFCIQSCSCGSKEFHPRSTRIVVSTDPTMEGFWNNEVPI